mgnify:CR=1 FL=1
MLENASQSASNQNTTPTPPTPNYDQVPLPVLVTSVTKEVENILGEDGDDLPPAEVETNHIDDEHDEKEPEVDNDRGKKRDPNYKARLAPGNNNRRTTRATRDPNIPHCSLLIQTLKYCASQAAKARLN